MRANKIKLDYGGLIHVAGKQWFVTVDRYLHIVPSSDEDWDPGTLLHDYKHPSTWPENVFPITGFAYMDKHCKGHCDYLHQLMAQVIPCSFYGDGDSLPLERVTGIPKKQVFTHGYSTQVKKPNYHHVYEAKTGKNLAFHYGYDKHNVADAFSIVPCGF